MDLSALTKMPAKAELYGGETYFREAWDDCREVLGACAANVLSRAALILIKGDGLAAGKASSIVAWVRELGFAIVAVEVPTLTGLHWREMWRYQLTSATIDRLAITDLVLMGRAVLILLRRHHLLDIPASVWLSQRKGVSDPACQAEDCFRRALGQPNRMLSFFHVADEPADIIRELGILLERGPRQRVFQAMATGKSRPEDRDRLMRELSDSDASPCALDPGGALDIVAAALEAARHDGRARQAATAGLAEIARLRAGARVSWKAFMASLAAAQVNVDRWTLARIGTAFVVYDQPGTTKLLTSVDPALWRSTDGVDAADTGRSEAAHVGL